MKINRFNVRIYGVCIENNCLLITDEIRGGMKMTKLPGGGLEFGEGIHDALVREFEEEMGILVEVGDVFFVNPFLEASNFCPSDQVVVVFYWVKLLERPEEAIFSDKPFDFEHVEGMQKFRWIPLSTLDTEMMTFKTDKALVEKLQAHCTGDFSRL